MKKLLIPSIFVLAAIAIVVGVFFYEKKGSAENTSDDDRLVNIGGIVVSEKDAKNLTVEVVPNAEAIAAVPTPDLDRPFVIPSKYPKEFQDAARVGAASAIADLKKDPIADNPDTYNRWLDLGILYLEIEDYRGAEAVWLYLEEVYPGTAPVTSANLGSLYHLRLKEYEKSEYYWRRAIESELPSVSHYIGLYELYRYSYKQNTAAAENILLEGIEKMGKKIDLIVRLASYYAEKGRTSEARTRYEEALALARAANNTALVSSISRDLSSLK